MYFRTRTLIQCLSIHVKIYIFGYKTTGQLLLKGISLIYWTPDVSYGSVLLEWAAEMGRDLHLLLFYSKKL